MQLKSKAEIAAAVQAAWGASSEGFAAADSSAVADRVHLCCAPYAAIYSSVNAIPWPVLIPLVMQIAAIIFSGAPPTLEQLQAVLQLIASIFTV